MYLNHCLLSVSMQMKGFTHLRYGKKDIQFVNSVQPVLHAELEVEKRKNVILMYTVLIQYNYQ